MTVNREACRTQLENGFGVPGLESILRPVAMDEDRLDTFVRLWNSNTVTALSDIVTTQFVTDRQTKLTLPQSQPVPFRFQDSEVLDVVRMTAVCTDATGSPVSLDRIYADLQIGSRSHVTSSPTPLSTFCGNGIDSWALPIPMRIAINQTASMSVTFDPTLTGDVTLSITLHALRLTF